MMTLKVILYVVAFVCGTQAQDSQEGKRISNTQGCSGFYKPGVNPKTPGSKFNDCVIDVPEGDHSTRAYFKLDEPIICQDDTVECAVIVTITTSDEQAVSVNPCQIKWTPSQWRETRFVEVSGKVEYSNNLQDMKIHLNTSVITSAEYYKEADVDDIYFVSENLRVAPCSANGDPHYKTMDGRIWHFYNKNPGQKQNRVTLHRSSQPNHDYIVQNQIRGYPARNCAIAAREGRNLVIIDACAGFVQRKLDFNTPYESHQPVVEVSGSTYTVYFRSGAWIRARASGAYVGITIEAVDYGHSCGICGNFNGDPWDDAVPMTSSNGAVIHGGCGGGTTSDGKCVQPRIDDYDYLDDCMKVPSTIPDLRYPSRNGTLGKLHDGGDLWAWTYNGRVCNSTVSTDCYPDEEAPPPAVTVCNASLDVVRPVIDTRPGSIEDVTDDLLQLNEEIHERCQARDDCNGWVFTDGNGQGQLYEPYDAEKSKQICQSKINEDISRMLTCVVFFGTDGNSLTGSEGSKIEELKKNLSASDLHATTFDYDEYLTDCADDYSALGGPTNNITEELLNATVRRMDRDCLDFCISTDCKSYSPDLRKNLTSALCEEGCNGHGACGDMGVCTCDEGFGASDCSIDMNAPPVLQLISEKAYDTAGHSLDNIDEIRIYGKNFQQNTTHARCRYGDPSDPKWGQYAQIVQAHWIGPTTVICPMPSWTADTYVNASYFDKDFRHTGTEAMELMLRVSNDGVLWSTTDAIFEFYDGVCEVCSHSDGVCKPNPSSCIVTDIGGNVQCYPDRTGNDDNPCEECRADLGITDRLTFDSNLNVRACAPVFDVRDYEFILKGNSTTGHYVGTVEATGNDLMVDAPGYKVTYHYLPTITDTSAKQWFTVSATDGKVTTFRDIAPKTLCMGLNHACDNPLVYHSGFQVKATDNFNVSSLISVDVPLLASETQDNPYKNYPTGFFGTIAEDAKAGDPVFDTDGKQLQIPFTLERDFFKVFFDWYRTEPGRSLSIDNVTGLVSVSTTSVLDFETNPVLKEVVSVEELSSEGKFENFFIVDLTVNVTNVEEPPSSLVNFTSQEPLIVIAIPETPASPEKYYADPVGSPLSLVGCEGPCGKLVELGAVDPEGGVLTYTIVNTVTHGIEVVDGTPPYLSATEAFNFEPQGQAANNFDLSIKVTDSSGLSSTFPVEFHITDVNEGMSSILFKDVGGGPTQIVDNTASSITVARGLIGRQADDLAEVVVTDIDGDAPLECAVVSAYFRIVNKNSKMYLQRKFFSCFDHEETSLNVLCDDALADKPTKRSGTKTYTILTGAMDVKPKLTAYASVVAEMDEGVVSQTATLLGNATFSDADSSTGTMSFTVEDPVKFSASLASPCTSDGVSLTCVAELYLRAGQTLSYEDYIDDAGVAVIGLTATNNESPDAVESCVSTSVEASIVVKDVIEPPSGFVTDPPILIINENAVNGDVVGSFSFVDDDSSSTYSSVTTPANGVFTIVEETDRRRQVTRKWNIVVADESKLDFAVSTTASLSVDLVEDSQTYVYTIPVLVADVRPEIVQSGVLKVASNVAPCPTDVTFTVENVDTAAWQSALTWRLGGRLAPFATLEADLTDPNTVTLVMTQTLPVGATDFYDFKVTADFGALTSTFLDSDPDSVTTFEFFEVETVEVLIAPDVSESSFSPDQIPYTGATTAVEKDLFTLTATSGNDADDTMFVYVVEYPFDTATQVTKSVYFDPACTQTNRYAYAAPTTTGGAEEIKVGVVDLFSGCTQVSSANSEWSCVVKVGVDSASAGTSFEPGTLAANGSLTAGLFVMAVFQRGGTPTVASFTPLTVSFAAEPTSTSTQTAIVIIEELASDQSSSVGVAVGAVMGIVLLILLVFAVIFFKRQRANAARDLFKGGPEYNANPAYASEGIYDESVGAGNEFAAGVENPLYSWYHPTMTRKESTEYLSNLGEGAFVVRDSDANPGWHMLGVKSQNDVIHEKIRLCQNQTYQLLVTGGGEQQPQLTSIPDLVNHYTTVQANVPYTLIDCDPIYDNSRLVQERTGVAQKGGTNGIMVPKKDTEYADLPVGQQVNGGANKGDDSVGNPLYFSHNDAAESTYSESDGYLDIKPDGTTTSGEKPQSYMDISPPPNTDIGL